MLIRSDSLPKYCTLEPDRKSASGRGRIRGSSDTPAAWQRSAHPAPLGPAPRTSKKRPASTLSAWRGMIVAPPGCSGSQRATSSTMPSIKISRPPAALATTTSSKEYSRSRDSNAPPFCAQRSSRSCAAGVRLRDASAGAAEDGSQVSF